MEKEIIELLKANGMDSMEVFESGASAEDSLYDCKNAIIVIEIDTEIPNTILYRTEWGEIGSFSTLAKYHQDIIYDYVKDYIKYRQYNTRRHLM